MLSAWLLVWVAAVRATPGAEHAPTPPSEHVPSSSVQDNHKYYTLSVYQNNAVTTFDDNFIDMERAEIKAGENTLESVYQMFTMRLVVIPTVVRSM